MAGPAPTTLEAPSEPEPCGPAARRDASVCPYFHEAVELLGKRWTGAIVHALLSGPMRFSELTHAVPQISDRLLSMRLKELEACGIVERDGPRRPPLRVEYALTAQGARARAGA